MTDSQRLAKRSSVHSSTDSVNAASFEYLAVGRYIDNQDNLVNSNKWYRKLLALPAYYWVLLAQVIVVLPHAAHLPLWLIGFAVVSICAQLPNIKARLKERRHLKRVYQGMQMLGFLLGLAGLWLTLQYRIWTGYGVAFLVLCLVSSCGSYISAVMPMFY